MKFALHFLILFSLVTWDASAFTKRPRNRPLSSGTDRYGHRHVGSTEVCHQTHANARRVAQQTGDIHTLIASQGGPGSSSLVQKAMNQIQCPPRNIGVGAGDCGRNGYRESTQDCAFYVRKALAGTLLPANTGGLGHASDMGCNLRNKGFRNLCGNSCGRSSATCNLDPYKAPQGAVLVYANTSRHCHWAGHAEIRTANGFVSDYFSSRPRNKATSCRRLIGVWIK